MEPGRYLNFMAKIDAKNEQWIEVEGQLAGVITDVMGFKNMHLS